MEVLGAFRAEQQEEGPGAATATQLVVLNCLQLPTPHHVFTRLWEKLSGQRLGPARCVKQSLVHHLLFCLPSLLVVYCLCATAVVWGSCWPQQLVGTLTVGGWCAAACAVVQHVPCLQSRLQVQEVALPSKLFVSGWLRHPLLPGAGPSACRAREALKQAFGIGQQQLGMVRRRYSTLVVLDEIDMLLTRDHGVRVRGSWGFAQRLAALC